MSAHASVDAAEYRHAILDAAQNRLVRYGYHKTTMAEIAHDVGMSAANLYRYFASKEEIAAECATRCLNDRLDRLHRIVEQPELTPGDKLLAYALELIDHSHALAGTDSKIGELVTTITRQRPALVHEKMAVHHELIGAIIRTGQQAGEFAPGACAARARDVYSTLILFDVPLFVDLFSREEFECRARGVVALLLDGLRKRPRRR